MYLTRILPIIALIITLSVPTVVSAQVPVEVSDEKVVSGGRVYYMHEVQKSQTLYSISRAYRVPITAITSENIIPPNGIQTGQVLKIPATDRQAAVTPQPRPVAQQTAAPTQPRPSQQTTRPDQGTPATAGSDDSGIRISGEKIVTSGKTFYMHEVQKGQTLYSIAKAYKVTILDIDRENAIPAGGIQAGQVLKIPAVTALTIIEEKGAPAVQAETTKPAVQDNAAAMPVEAKQNTEVKPEPATQTQPEVKSGSETTTKTEEKPQPGVQQETPAASKSEIKEKPAQPQKKKIHKVQKGESLTDIAKKYNISVQELKQANKGVIFAMPDMRLVIPVKDE